MSSSRFHRLVPISFAAAAVEAEADAGAGSNRSVSSTAKDEENAASGSGYRLPPPEIMDIVDAPPLPALSFSPQRDKIRFLKRRALPPLAELAKPEEKLAGIRIDGKCNTRSRM